MKVWSQEGFVFQWDTIKIRHEKPQQGKRNLCCFLTSPSTHFPLPPSIYFPPSLVQSLLHTLSEEQTPF